MTVVLQCTQNQNTKSEQVFQTMTFYYYQLKMFMAAKIVNFLNCKFLQKKFVRLFSGMPLLNPESFIQIGPSTLEPFNYKPQN